MQTHSPSPQGETTLWQFLNSEAAGGIVLMAVAALAIITANSPLAAAYFHALHVYIGPMSLQHWINDALMATFFLMVGLEIKREMTEGHLATWPARLLPGVAALGGMALPALVFLAFNRGSPELSRGWAIPTATDIAFALGVLALLGPRVPVALKVFLAALAIIDDLGAVIVIALFYSGGLSGIDLGLAALVVVALVAMNRLGVSRLLPYLLLGVVLWVFVWRSGLHATLAGVVLALTIPVRHLADESTSAVEAPASPLHRLERLLHKPVGFFVVPLFGFANAGVSFAGLTPAVLTEPLTLGIAGGLLIGKLLGVFGAVTLLVRSGLAKLPEGAGWTQVLGVALLCGIGFTMSLFIGLLAFDDAALQDRVKIGILAGSLLAGVLGAAVLWRSGRA
ncbi:Na+/H+ antiporter NhaA [Rhodobacter ferrooxidans]|uniref:Na(+)/H(+) antiporter NhaA n=1 Tax=Rhodobacter ferrooxidans TaxID=371731 RepID=C8S1I2_9RHOB|nr:Na+/H+ antiporter NhaA [Rhodobacter sp. SW2]EEW25155.1 Na+/H+ antiporter NhaA [Rhodobacter sp. SW2]